MHSILARIPSCPAECALGRRFWHKNRVVPRIPPRQTGVDCILRQPFNKKPQVDGSLDPGFAFHSTSFCGITRFLCQNLRFRARFVGQLGIRATLPESPKALLHRSATAREGLSPSRMLVEPRCGSTQASSEFSRVCARARFPSAPPDCGVDVGA